MSERDEIVRAAQEGDLSMDDAATMLEFANPRRRANSDERRRALERAAARDPHDELAKERAQRERERLGLTGWVAWGLPTKPGEIFAKYWREETPDRYVLAEAWATEPRTKSGKRSRSKKKTLGTVFVRAEASSNVGAQLGRPRETVVFIARYHTPEEALEGFESIASVVGALDAFVDGAWTWEHAQSLMNQIAASAQARYERTASVRGNPPGRDERMRRLEREAGSDPLAALRLATERGRGGQRLDPLVILAGAWGHRGAREAFVRHMHHGAGRPALEAWAASGSEYAAFPSERFGPTVSEVVAAHAALDWPPWRFGIGDGSNDDDNMAINAMLEEHDPYWTLNEWVHALRGRIPQRDLDRVWRLTIMQSPALASLPIASEEREIAEAAVADDAYRQEWLVESERRLLALPEHHRRGSPDEALWDALWSIEDFSPHPGQLPAHTLLMWANLLMEHARR